MGLKRDEPQVQYLLIKHKIVEDKVEEDVEEHVGPAAGRVAKGMSGHHPSEQRVKKID